MNISRIVVLTIALNASGGAAYLASGSDNKPPPAEPVAQLRTAEVLVAKADTGLGQTVAPNDVQWRSWPALTANSISIRQGDHSELKPEQTSTPADGRRAGTLSLALRSVGDTNQVELGSDDQFRRRTNINAVRYGVNHPTIMQN